ncbi:MAG: hypothetical protein ACRCZO_10340 [Cetobacterium sp.]|uniref:hypothetical protein n=1 Tax=Cetobacterium sp. TaxID=2071632 RepID=UPI003EE73CAE
MKKIGYLLLIIIFILFELLLFYRYGNEIKGYRSIFWLSHFLLSFIFIFFNSYFRGERQFDIFIVIFPIIGFVMLFINQLLFFRKLFQSEIEINQDLERYISEEYENKVIDRSIDLNLIGAYDILAVGTPYEKKDFLIGFETHNLKFKVEVLKKALWDNDIEVIHYAATEINKIDEEFQKNIKEKTEKNDLEALCKIYFEYCESGLLKDEVLEFYQKRYLELLSQKEILSSDDLYMELIVCRDMKNHERCNSIIKTLIENKNKEKNIVELIKKYYYDMNDKKMLKEVEEWQESV